ncbi:MAG: NUDIX hydrolase [Pyrinomonadaceae bacterium]|nr:NUDIX hydrolase [Pyrinomonadaceae bacterium]
MKQILETWTRKQSKAVADCRVFKVREDACERDSDGKAATFFVIENPDWVNVIALTKEKQVVLIEQFRHGSEEIILEIPGGMMDENETAEFAAKRELLEETGYSSDEFVYLGKSRPNPAIQNNWIYHYAALNCEKTQETAFDEHESVITKLVALANIENLVESGKITHSLAIVGFYYLNLSNKI